MALEYSAKEFIKMYRKFMQWEWYTDINTKTLFIHCLLRANWKAGVWQGIHYDKGEFITSLPKIAEESGLTVRQVRTSLEHLISTGELTSSLSDKVTGKKLTKCRIITVNNWDEYQNGDRQKRRQPTDKASCKRQGSDRQPTADKEYKENKEVKEIKEEPAALSPSEPDDEGGWMTVDELIEKRGAKKDGHV